MLTVTYDCDTSWKLSSLCRILILTRPGNYLIGFVTGQYVFCFDTNMCILNLCVFVSPDITCMLKLEKTFSHRESGLAMII